MADGRSWLRKAPRRFESGSLRAACKREKSLTMPSENLYSLVDTCKAKAPTRICTCPGYSSVSYSRRAPTITRYSCLGIPPTWATDKIPNVRRSSI
ncbi:hypothetical protein OKW43_000851 [Paraburkholderia sp. WC7.3g]